MSSDKSGFPWLSGELWFLHPQWAHGPREFHPSLWRGLLSKGVCAQTDVRFQSGTATAGEGRCHFMWVHTSPPRRTSSCTACMPDREIDCFGMMVRDRWNGNKDRNLIRWPFIEWKCCFTVCTLLIVFSENEISPGFGKSYSASKYLPGSVPWSLCVAVSCKVRVIIPSGSQECFTN